VINQVGLPMFTPIGIMVGIIAVVVFIGLFLDYGKRKHWDKPSTDKSSRVRLMPHPSHRTVRTDLVYGSCNLLFLII